MSDIGQLAEALAKAQAAIESPAKNKTVTVKTGNNGSYSFSYATLDAIIDAVRKPLAENGLSFVQLLEGGEDGKFRLVTQLMHSSGQYIRSVSPILVGEGNNKNQAFASGLTYQKRYALSSMLGVCADEDTDGNSDDLISKQDVKRPEKPANDKPAKPPQVKAENAAEQWVNKALIELSSGSITQGDWLHSNQKSVDALKARDPAQHERLMNFLNGAKEAA